MTAQTLEMSDAPTGERPRDLAVFYDPLSYSAFDHPYDIGSCATTRPFTQRTPGSVCGIPLSRRPGVSAQSRADG